MAVSSITRQVTMSLPSLAQVSDMIHEERHSDSESPREKSSQLEY